METGGAAGESGMTATLEPPPTAPSQLVADGPGTPPQLPLPVLTPAEYAAVAPVVEAYHTYRISRGQCSSLLSQRTTAPPDVVWSIVRRFERPQVYKHFIRTCTIKGDGEIRVGCLRELRVISGLPASDSTERLDMLDDGARALGFSIIGGEHRLRNYRSATTVTEVPCNGEAGAVTLVLESYVVDVPEGNTEEDTKLFADTVIRLNLQKLASVAEAASARAGSGSAPLVSASPA